MARIRADQHERGDRPIRAYPRNPRLVLLTRDNRENGVSAPSLFAPVQFFRLLSVFHPRSIRGSYCKRRTAEDAEKRRDGAFLCVPLRTLRLNLITVRMSMRQVPESIRLSRRGPAIFLSHIFLSFFGCGRRPRCVSSVFDPWLFLQAMNRRGRGVTLRQRVSPRPRRFTISGKKYNLCKKTPDPACTVPLYFLSFPTVAIPCGSQRGSPVPVAPV
jgi:hypothetical protein